MINPQAFLQYVLMWQHTSQLRHGGVLVALMVISVSILSCNQREEGCLDVDARNFDFEADRHVQSMCSYPDLILSVTYSWGDSVFVPGKFYENSLGQSVAILQGRLLLSQFYLETVDNGEFSVNNTVEWPGDILDVPDDFVFVDRSAFWYRLGELRRSDLLERYRFYIGIPDTLTPVNRDDLPDGHVLRGSKANYDSELGTFAAARFVIGRDTVVANQDTFLVFGPATLCEFDVAKDLVQGRNDSLKIEVNFGALFAAVDLDRDSASIVSEIAANLKSTILDRN